MRWDEVPGRRNRIVRGRRLWATRNPRTFTEKVRYKMLRDHRRLVVTFADKAAVRAHVAALAGEPVLPGVRDPRRPGNSQLRDLALPTRRAQADSWQRRRHRGLPGRTAGHQASRSVGELGLSPCAARRRPARSWSP